MKKLNLRYCSGILSGFPVFPPREPALRISGTLEPGCQLERGRSLRGRILVVNTTHPKCRILLQLDGFFRYVQRCTVPFVLMRLFIFRLILTDNLDCLT
jgi:hypothetical protein